MVTIVWDAEDILLVKFLEANVFRKLAKQLVQQHSGKLHQTDILKKKNNAHSIPLNQG